jgi:hypothetical protein
MDYFKLIRDWWDFAFENPEKVKSNHSALYLFILEHCNRLGWKTKFGLPTTMAKDAIGIRSYNTYIITLNDLIGFGFIELIEKSKNQYSSNIIAISYFDKALDKALDKAFIKHDIKQSESTMRSIDSINTQYTNIPINNIQNTKEGFSEIEILPINNQEQKRKKVAPKKEINLPNEFIEIWDLWIEYRTAKKIKNYANDKFEQMAVDKLIKFSNNNPVIAKQIIEESITNSWTGFFELKTKHNNGEQITTKQQFRFDSSEAVKTITGSN